MCDTGGVGVLVFPRCCEEGICVDGGGVISDAARSMRLVSMVLEGAAFLAIVACGISGVAGIETWGGGSRASRLSCDACEAIAGPEPQKALRCVCVCVFM